ncbi:MAG: Collagen triple helix repeat protein [Candidatus Nomurabacteria bacterium]|nr:Collagen triple helix repeat protein [Candidatus Nomurabacteria bacterium]
MKNKIILSVLSTIIFSLFITTYSQGQAPLLGIIFTKTLQATTKDDQVGDLQQLFKRFPGVYPEGKITNYFGVSTKAAVRRFQAKHGIRADGIVGPVTREKLNQFLTKGSAGPTGSTGTQGVSGGRGSDGAAGSNGIPGATGATGNTGTDGTPGSDGIPGSIGLTGITGETGAQGNIGATGAKGDIGNTGLAGNPGTAGAIGTSGSNGTNGSNGAAGIIGTTGLTGDTGPAGTTGATGLTGLAGTNGAVSSALYVRYGSQPATVGAGQPFTYSTTILSTTGITSATAVFNPPFTASGTIFTLTNIGRYEIQYQMSYPTDGGIVLYAGSSLATMAPITYSMVGKSPDTPVNGNVIIQTTAVNSVVSVNAAAGNAAAIGIPPNSSTTNQNATTVSFKQIQ